MFPSPLALTPPRLHGEVEDGLSPTLTRLVPLGPASTAFILVPGPAEMGFPGVLAVTQWAKNPTAGARGHCRGTCLIPSLVS